MHDALLSIVKQKCVIIEQSSTKSPVFLTVSIKKIVLFSVQN